MPFYTFSEHIGLILFSNKVKMYLQCYFENYYQGVCIY